MEELREIRWIASAKKNLLAMPLYVRKAVGFVLDRVQRGKQHKDIKPLTGLGSGMYEIRTDYDTDTYRTVYVVNIGKFIYVLHVFKKKSKKGKEIPKSDIDLIKQRLKLAREDENNEQRKR